MHTIYKYMEGVSEVFALALKTEITAGDRDSMVYSMYCGLVEIV